jgi:hypothetical protein
MMWDIKCDKKNIETEVDGVIIVEEFRTRMISNHPSAGLLLA